MGQSLLVYNMAGHGQVANIGICLTGCHGSQRLLIRIEQCQLDPGVIPFQLFLNDKTSRNSDCISEIRNLMADLQDEDSVTPDEEAGEEEK